MSNLTQERIDFETLGQIYPPDNSVNVTLEHIANVPTYLFTPQQLGVSETIIYLHGGGFIYGSIKSHRAMISHFASALQRRILLVEYSLAPEKPFPNALNETVAVIKALSHQPDFEYALAGDSAGGGLALSVALSVQSIKMKQPLYQILISPWLKINTIYPSYVENAQRDPIITKAFVNYAAELYMGNEDPEHSLMSPINNDLAGLSPTLVLVGLKEVLRDDSLILHEKLIAAESPVELVTYEDVTHVWMLSDVNSDPARHSLRTMYQFIERVAKPVGAR